MGTLQMLDAMFIIAELVKFANHVVQIFYSLIFCLCVLSITREVSVFALCVCTLGSYYYVHRNLKLLYLPDLTSAYVLYYTSFLILGTSLGYLFPFFYIQYFSIPVFNGVSYEQHVIALKITYSKQIILQMRTTEV